MKVGINNIKLKLTLFYTFILVILLLAFHFVAYSLLSSGLSHNLTDSLTIELQEGQITQGNSGEFYFFTYNVGTIDENQQFTEIEDVPVNIADAVQTDNSGKFYTYDGDTYYFIPDTENGEYPDKIIRITRNSDFISRTLDEYRNILFAAIPVILLLALASGYLLSNYLLRPVNAITKTAYSIDPANLVDRLEVKSNDELGNLSRALNSLFDKIYGFLNRQRQFTGATSHDMKSPVSIIKMEVSGALKKERTVDEYKNTLISINEEADRLNVMINDLMSLAVIDAAPLQAGTTKLNLSEIINGILNRWESPFGDKGVRLERNVSCGVSIIGDERHFAAITENLIKNAFEYTTTGGSVTCSLEVLNHNIVLRVADSGTGIDEKHLPHIFERFYKADGNKPGNGLGLAIVAATVKMYNGNITVESEQGKGSVFTVTLPADK
jgi:two-component system heavy metal sensor histidine kinase CusS